MGGAAGRALAQRMKITELPQTVAAFHSLVGGAAVATSVAAFMAHPELADSVHLASTWFGTFIGAVTLTGTWLYIADSLPERNGHDCSFISFFLHAELKVGPAWMDTWQ